MTTDWKAAATELTTLLNLRSPPIAISYDAEPPAGVAPFDEPMSEPTEDGRSGRVPASCVFWMKAVDRTFTTIAADHGNCSVGRLTHGFASLDDVSDKQDVAALLESGWVNMDQVLQIPTLSTTPGAITYGPLAETPVEPDVVFIRIDARQLMILTDAVEEVHVGGKPQCHILALAHEHGRVAASFGCALSRERTGMPASEMTCAIPAGRVPEVLDKIGTAESVDGDVAQYAAQDARRFA